MRTLRIDFTAENMLPDGDYIGRIGEHNATDLVITPPAEMAQCEEIINYVAAFVTEGKIIRSDFYPKAEQITVSLCSQLTQDHTLGVQLEGYDGSGGLVVKSPVISELRLLPSAGGDETDFNGEDGGIVSQINLNTIARHEHSNSAVLEGLSEANGTLAYNGIPVSEGKTNTVILKSETGDFMIDITNLVMNFIVCNSLFDSPPVPEGADIKKIEFNLIGEESWTDIRTLLKYDVSVPVLVQNLRAFQADGATYIAQVDFYSGKYNEFYDLATNCLIDKLRVVYTCDEG
ncbi:MAG: hypothetical protein IJO03_01010 [Clostridia bacterium]|nr:hypothetical protein [Clostridia bacterium]MBQ7120819.1 hypothetical protein [Clostridia bacterium]